MNVQTLPPGYKVAPWTPPEKIDGKMLADASAKLIDLLRIRTQPIGMRLFEDPADMEKIQGVRKPTDGMKFTMCQMVTQLRWYGFTLGITVDNTRGGNCGGVVGLNHPGEGFLSGDHMNGVWFGNKEASAAHQAQMPRVPDGKYNGLVVALLREADDTALRRLRAQYHPREAGLIGPHFTLVFGVPMERESVLRDALAAI